MLRQTRLSVWSAAAVVALLVGLFPLIAPPAALAQAADPGALIQAHLDAGEFAPAIGLARAIGDPNRRDAWFGRIAVAQARAGARDASLRSAAVIDDDVTRTRALEGVAAQPLGGQGGAAQADFESLLDLITSTIKPDSWDDVGGPGSVKEFPTGVYVDAQGVLKPGLKKDASGRLAALRRAGAARAYGDTARRRSPLRKVSLTRLERHVQLRLAAGQEPTEPMQVLAGLERIQYVFVYTDSGEIVVAGPAGDWTTDAENRIVSTQTGAPVVRLDDLVVVLRHMTSGPDAKFGCAITPTQQALARTKAFLDKSQKTSIRPYRRDKWLEQLRSQVGQQDIDVYGLDPHTRAARVMVEADYRMKLVGMGLEEGVPGVESYLGMVKVPKGMAPPAMDVLRWWFTMNYDAVLASPDRAAFEIRGQGVKVQSENEFLTAQGNRVHTGKSDALNRQFAHNFTAHFADLCAKYPIYAELRNLFDLALVGALVRSEGLAEKTGWHMTCFGDPKTFQVELDAAPEKVDTVINHRVVNRVHILAGVSGGVRADPTALVAHEAIQLDRDKVLARHQSAAAPKQSPDQAWWWD